MRFIAILQFFVRKNIKYKSKINVVRPKNQHIYFKRRTNERYGFL